MDSAAAVQEGLVEDRSGSGTSAQPEGPPKPPGSLAPLDQWDEAQCSTEASLPLEKEEQVRLQARKRLEEQLKQYRVKRQQERVSLPLSNQLMEKQAVSHNSRICCLFLF
uniref:Golgin A3 n=1 Tax=Ovis aries TaxID=9940 RepID=A0AC11EGS4_SHEEP